MTNASSDTSRLGATMRLRGSISGSEALEVRGSVDGDVVLADDAQLTIAEGARVRADLRAAHVVIAGAVQGHVTATVRVTLLPQALVEGTVHAPRLCIDLGAELHGAVNQDAAAAPQAAVPAAPQVVPHVVAPANAPVASADAPHRLPAGLAAAVAMQQGGSSRGNDAAPKDEPAGLFSVPRP